MLEWAQRAGTLALKDIHEFRDDSLVTLINLSIFWHGEGSWRKAILYKGFGVHLSVMLRG